MDELRYEVRRDGETTLTSEHEPHAVREAYRIARERGSEVTVFDTETGRTILRIRPRGE